MNREKDPAPALTRGLALIRQLSREGQGMLEHLAQRGGWPKSSTLRYLQALELAGVVEQDPASKVWHLRERLVPLSQSDQSLLESWRDRLGGLSHELGHCVELYQTDPTGVTLIDRADPLVLDKQLSARIGFVRDLSECDASALVYFAFSGHKPAAGDLRWRWRDGGRARVQDAERSRLLRETRHSGIAIDQEFNINGIRRFAFGLIDRNGALEGIVAIAQRLTPLSGRQTETLRAALDKLHFDAIRSSEIRTLNSELQHHEHPLY